MGIASDFQGRWKGWKTWGRFSRLSTARHFHSVPASTRFSSFLLLLGCAAEAIRFGPGFQNVRPIRDAIQQRLCTGARSGSPASIPKTDSSSGSPLLSRLARPPPETETSLRLRPAVHNRLIDSNQIITTQPRQHAAQLQLVLGLDQFVHQAAAVVTRTRRFCRARRYAQAGQQMSFSSSAQARNIMPMGPRSSRLTIHFTHYTVSAFALNGGRCFQKGNTSSASCRWHLGGFPSWIADATKSPNFTVGPPLTSAVALAELRKLLDSLHSNSQRGTASLKEMRREDTNGAKENTGDDTDELAVL